MRDTEAVASIVAGDPDGLATAYDRYADPLFSYCRSLLGDTAEAADAVQDTFVIAAARLDGLHDPQRLRAWLFAVARGECLRVLRSSTRRRALPKAPVTGADVSDADSDSGDEAAGRARLRALFEHAWAGLGPAEREVIELRLRQGLEPDELATVLGVSRGRAHVLGSRAADQLEACLGVLLVARAGRAECAQLGSLLAGWDGRLTAALSKRVGRHVEHCSACSARRTVELRPSMLLELAPAAALAAGAAGSFRSAPGAPAALKAHTIALATERGSAPAAHAMAVLSRAGTFGRQGFPKQAHGVPGPAGAGPRHKARSSAQRQAAVAAAVVLAAGIAAAGFALSGGQRQLSPVADPTSPAAAGPPAATTGAAAARASTPAASARRSHADRTTTPTGTPTASTIPAPTTAPTTAGASSSPSAATTSPSPTASTSPSASPSQPSGKLWVFPGGGSLSLVPGGRGALVYLSAWGGTVDWSVSVSGDPGHTITVSPATSGTLTAAHSHTAVEISASQNLSCGYGGNACPTITIEPSGTTLTVTTSGRRHPFRHRRRPDRHDGRPGAAPLSS
jgi:RNA polymerase sigma factor (sigma-70 family)